MSFNIYVLDVDPSEAARSLADRHLLAAFDHARAVLETATVLRRAASAGSSVSRGTQHPRHPITRHAARSAAYAAWVAAYGEAVAHELSERGLNGIHDADIAVSATVTNACREVRELFAELDAEPCACPVEKRRLFADEVSALGLTTFPQRLTGAEDLVVPGDPVAGYRRWYAETKVTGAPRAWDGAGVVWTRRAPPSWLVAADRGYVAEDVPWLGLGERPVYARTTVIYSTSHTR